jgi:putative tryptophan/tyrosine transport system substrate-binding protein
MKRRKFISLLGGAAAAWPLAARAQRSERVRRIGMLIGYAEKDAETQARLAAFRQGLEHLGWAEGRNVLIDYRFAPANSEQAQRFAKELVALQPEVLVGNSTPATAALLRETHYIPIVIFQSCLWACPIRSVAASSRALRGRAAMSPALTISSHR